MNSRSNHRRCSVKKVFLEILQNSQKNKFCKISKDTFSYRTPLVATSGTSPLNGDTSFKCWSFLFNIAKSEKCFITLNIWNMQWTFPSINYNITCNRLSRNLKMNAKRFISYTAQKMKFSIKDFFSTSYQIRSFLRVWSHLLKKSFIENLIFCAVFAIFCLFFVQLKWCFKGYGNVGKYGKLIEMFLLHLAL